MTTSTVVVPEEETKCKIKLLDIQEGCVICGKPNPGRHYGVNCVCLGCKTFYRRAVIQNRIYFCDNNFQCDPREKKARGPCAACRLSRCYLAGMTKCALRGRRDIIAPKGKKRSRSMDSESPTDEPTRKKSVLAAPGAPEAPGSANSQASSVHRPMSNDKMEIETIRQLTILDQALRERKMQRFQSLIEARRLACTVLGQTDVPFLYFTGLRIELAALTSMEMHTMLEWVTMLSFYPKMTNAHRVFTVKRFAVYQLVIETGYCTAKSDYDNCWVLPNNTCMPLSIENLPVESQKIVSPARKWRQDRLYGKMTKNCIDVGQAFRRLKILPEELAVLKTILFCECSKNEEASDDAIKMVESYKDLLFRHLFSFYRHQNIENFEERFANLILDISLLVSTASSITERFRQRPAMLLGNPNNLDVDRKIDLQITLVILETFQVMRVFQIVPFDAFSERLLFNSESSSSI